MLIPVRFLMGLLLPVSMLVACSSPESQERLNTALCWLRPSCLPSHPSSPSPKPPATPTPKMTSSQRTKPKQPQVVPHQSTHRTTCLTAAKATVKASKPFVTVSYLEPTTKANGQPLTNLAKTTIYLDLGKGLIKYKDIPATNPQGGETIQEKIPFTLSAGETIQATICVTATDTNGREG
ncbi:MAG: hypothetical protein V3U07_05830 [Nitrospirales bacterium]